VKTVILDGKQIDSKIIRIAHEIAEFNYNEPGVMLIGIADRGFQLAERIKKELALCYTGQIELGSLTMDKSNPVHCDYMSSISLAAMNGKSVILIDDVLESGKTLIYGAKYLLGADVKKLTTIVLVDRMHPKFPIKADFVGLTLSTTLQEHIYVDLTPGSEAVFLQ